MQLISVRQLIRQSLNALISLIKDASVSDATNIMIYAKNDGSFAPVTHSLSRQFFF